MGAVPGRSKAGTPNSRALGATIRALRSHARLSQEVLGKRARMHQNYLGALERGEISSPGLEPLCRIAHGLGVSIAVLAESYAHPPSDGVLRVDAAKWPFASAGCADDAQALGAAIRLVRRSRGVTQERLGSDAGIHRAYLGSIEAGEKRSPGIASIARIARGLERDREGLLLPVLARVYAGEATLADVQAALNSKASRSSDTRRLPQASTDS